ncbi:MAG: glycine cleavage system aminomethyltransferase GcvT [bacterium]
MENLKKTPLHEEHIKLGAKMVPFAGWEMPLQYSSIIDEHLTVRNKVGLFDIAHMGEIFIWGDNALDLLQKLTPQDISKLAAGKALYSQFLNEKAGIIDDLIIYRLENKNNKKFFLLIINASRINEDLNWLKINAEKNKYDLEIENKSDNLTLLAVQGPLSGDLLEELGIPKSNQPKKFSIKQYKLAYSDVFVARTGYTGEDGFEILIDNDNAHLLWQELLLKGQKFNIKPIGLGARDTLRLEASLLLYGQDMDENTTPVEASLGWSVSKKKKEDYLGKEIILSQLLNKNFNKVLIGFKMLDKFIPRHNYEIFKDNEKIGFVSSGGVAPYIGINVGLGYISAKMPTFIGAKLDIKIREKFHPAEIVKIPFYISDKKG